MPGRRLRLRSPERGDGTEAARVALTDADAEVEPDPGTWTLEAVEEGRTVGTEPVAVSHEPSTHRASLVVDPHTVDVTVTGGPERRPLDGVTVEAVADVGEWSARQSTDSEGTATFDLPGSASGVTVRATREDLPTAQSTRPVERAAAEGVELSLADGTGGLSVETTAGGHPWPGVEVTVAPVAGGAAAHTDEDILITNDEGRRRIGDLPARGRRRRDRRRGVVRHRLRRGGDRRAAPDRGPVLADRFPARPGGDARRPDRRTVGGLGPRRAIPRYYRTVLAAVLEVVEEVTATPSRAVVAGGHPDSAVDALLGATERGIDAVADAMSERRVVRLFGACASMPPATVEWNGAERVTLAGFRDRAADGADHERHAFRERLAETDDVPDRRLGEVGENAPVRTLHDRLGGFVSEPTDADPELAVVARAYVGVHLLAAIEELFGHDPLRRRLDGRILRADSRTATDPDPGHSRAAPRTTKPSPTTPRPPLANVTPRSSAPEATR